MPNRLKIIVSMLTLYVVWGTTYLAIKVGVDAKLPPALFAGLRLVPAGLIMFGIARLRGCRLTMPLSELRVVSIVGLMLLVGGQYGMMVAEQYVPSGIAALVVAVVPLWIALAESLFADMQRPSKTGWIGLALGFSGLAILLAPRLTSVKTGATELLGLAIVVGGTWLWSGGSIYSKRHPVTADGMVVTAHEMLIAGATTLLLGTVLGEWGRLSFNPRAVGALLYLIVFGSCVAFTAFIYALKHLPASKVMTYAYVNPVIAVFAGWGAGAIDLVPDEPIQLWTLIGMVVIVAGVALTTAAPTLPPRSAAPTAESSELRMEPEPSEV